MMVLRWSFNSPLRSSHSMDGTVHINATIVETSILLWDPPLIIKSEGYTLTANPLTFNSPLRSSSLRNTTRCIELANQPSILLWDPPIMRDVDASTLLMWFPSILLWDPQFYIRKVWWARCVCPSILLWDLLTMLRASSGSLRLPFNSLLRSSHVPKTRPRGETKTATSILLWDPRSWCLIPSLCLGSTFNSPLRSSML